MQWLIIYEAAEFTGFFPQTLYNRRSKGLRPQAKKVGNRLRYHVDELEDWIASNGAKHPRRGRPPKH